MTNSSNKTTISGLPSQQQQDLLGVYVKIETTAGKEFEGYIYTYDNTHGVVVLQKPSHLQSSSTFDYHILKLNYIKEVVSSQDIPKKKDILVPISYVSIEKLMAKERQLIREEKEKMARRGVGVTEEAQNIFDALAKTLPVRWHGTDIIVMNEIKISSPYTTSDCKSHPNAADKNQVLLDRVKKVLEGERKKLNL